MSGEADPAAELERGLAALSPARRALFDEHRALVEAVAKYEVPRLRRLVAPDDLMQEGRIGLMKACVTFDPEAARRAGRSFVDWAKPLIRWQMRKAVRTEARHEKRVLRASQATAAEQVAYCARAAHPYDDDDERVKGLLSDVASTAAGAMAACLAGSILRVPGEEGVLLRLTYAGLLAAVAEERARLDPFAEWVLARKYDDGMTWAAIEEAAKGPTVAQLRYIHDKALAALGRALRERGFDPTPPAGGRSPKK